MAFNFRSLNRTEAIAHVDSAVPTSLTTVVSADCMLFEVQIVNPTGSPISVALNSITSGNFIIPTINVPAGGVLTLTNRRGRFCQGGVQWQAGGSGLTGYIQSSPS
jgi:hypothetical protein